MYLLDGVAYLLRKVMRMTYEHERQAIQRQPLLKRHDLLMDSPYWHDFEHGLVVLSLSSNTDRKAVMDLVHKAMLKDAGIRGTL